MRKLAIIFALSTSPLLAQDVVDGPGPNLVIEVSGKANGTVVIDMADHFVAGQTGAVAARVTKWISDRWPPRSRP